MKDLIRDIQTKVTPVLKKYNVHEAILFGSYAKGVASERSDIDLCVDSRLHGMRFVGLIEDIRSVLGGRSVDLLDISHINPDSAIADKIKRTGIKIYER